MANIKITGFPEQTQIDDADFFHVKKEGQPDRKVAWGNIKKDTIKPVASVADLRLLVGSYDGQQASLTSYHAGANKGGGIFVWDAASTATDDGGVTFAVTGVATGRWVRQLDGFVTPEMFGAWGDGVNPDTSPLSSSISFCIINRKKLSLIGENYRVSEKISTSLDGKLEILGNTGSKISIDDGIESVNLSAAALVFNGLSALKITGVTVETNSTNGCGVIHAVGCKNVKINNNTIAFHNVSVGSKCIIVQRSDDFSKEVKAVSVCNNTLYPGGVGALVLGLSNVKPRGVHMDGNTVIYNLAVNDAALKIDKFTKNFTMNGNTVYGGGLLSTGLAVEKQANSGIISGNQVCGATSRAINVNVDPDEGSVPLNDITIKNNSLTADGFNCLYAVYLNSFGTTSRNITVKNNTISGFRASIFEAKGGQIDNLVLKSNTMLDCKGTAMNIKSNNSLIRGNTTSAAAGISAYSLVTLKTATGIKIVKNDFDMYLSAANAAIQASLEGFGSGLVMRGNTGLKANTSTAYAGDTVAPLGVERILMFPSSGAVALTLENSDYRGEGSIEFVSRSSTNPCTVNVLNYNNQGAKTLNLIGTGAFVRLIWTGYTWVQSASVAVTVT